jgi:hypothetical protein
LAKPRGITNHTWLKLKAPVAIVVLAVVSLLKLQLQVMGRSRSPGFVVILITLQTLADSAARALPSISLQTQAFKCKLG